MLCSLLYMYIKKISTVTLLYIPSKQKMKKTKYSGRLVNVFWRVDLSRCELLLHNTESGCLGGELSRFPFTLLPRLLDNKVIFYLKLHCLNRFVFIDFQS